MDEAIIISLTSLVISFLAFYFSILKRAKVKFKVFRRVEDVSFNGHGSYQGISSGFTVMIPVIAINKGANSAIVNDIKWRVIKPESINYKIYINSSFEDSVKNNYTTFKPYENRVANIEIHLEINGNGKGFNNEEFKKSYEEIKLLKFNNKVNLELQYKESKIHKMKSLRKTYDISDIVEHGFKRIY